MSKLYLALLSGFLIQGNLLATELSMYVSPAAATAALKQPGADSVRVPQIYIFNKNDQLIFVGLASSSQDQTAVIAALANPKAPELENGVTLFVQSTLTQKKEPFPTLVYVTTAADLGVCTACEPYYPELFGALKDEGIEFNKLAIILTKLEKHLTLIGTPKK